MKVTHSKNDGTVISETEITITPKESTLPKKPPKTHVNVENIPKELKNIPQWVVWKYVYKVEDKKFDKILYTVKGGLASTTNPETWCDFEAAINKYRNDEDMDGIGIVFTREAGIMGVDLDKITDDIRKEMDDNIQLLNSYTELSPSGKGYHIYVKARLPSEEGKKKEHIEMYDHGRFFTVTGDRVGSITTVNTSQNAVNSLFNKSFPEPPKEIPNEIPGKHVDEDNDIVRWCLLAANHDKFEKLWNNDNSDYGGDESAGDEALCCILAFYTHDRNQIERIFNRSRRTRDKWIDRSDYRDRTIGYAISHVKLRETIPVVEKSVIKVESEWDDFEFNIPDETEPFEARLPDDNYVKMYMTYASDMTSSCIDYHHALGISTLSTVVGRNAVCRFSYEDILAHIWVYYLGKTSRTHKTAALRRGQKVLEGIVNFLPEKFSAEGLFEEIADNPQNPLFLDEAASLFKIMTTYGADIEDLMCKLYDAPSVYNKKLSKGRGGKRPQYTIKEPYTPVVMASTPASLKKSVNISNFQTGFMIRFAFYYPQYNVEQKPSREINETDIARQKVLVERLNKIKTLFKDHHVEFTLSPKAREFYNEWERRITLVPQKYQLSEVVASNIARLQIFAIKLSMIYTIGDSKFVDNVKNTLGDISVVQIDLPYLKEACREIEEYYIPMIQRVENEIKIEKGSMQDDIIDVIRNYGGACTATEVYRKIRGKPSDRKQAIADLVETDELEEIILETQNKPIKYYRLKDKYSFKRITTGMIK